MVRVTGFMQRDPHDGQPASQPTEAYLGYDEKNLYVVFVCFDEPGKVSAHMSRREDIFSDDNVEIILDTFHDKRRAYAFQTNPLGVQWDAIWTEEAHEDSTGNIVNFDTSFDTVWDSRGKLTPQGYVVWMAIPFKSLRFSPQHDQTWGLISTAAFCGRMKTISGLRFRGAWKGDSAKPRRRKGWRAFRRDETCSSSLTG